MIERASFGSTGHESSRIIFGAAALAAMKQDRADRVLERLLDAGINHIDTAASYGESELRVGPWMREHRKDFFLASKTGDRGGPAAKESLQRSLERLQVDQLDLIQLHNLVDENDWQQAFADGGAVPALIEARDEGLVRFIGVTGHGTRVARMHIRSLERYDFASVLVPCNYTMNSQSEYRADFEELVALCEKRNVAVQTIKSAARRRWTDDNARKFSWYEPLRDADAIRRGVHFVLSRPGLFLNTSSDATILDAMLDAAEAPFESPADSEMEADIERFDMQPLFLPGLDAI